MDVVAVRSLQSSKVRPTVEGITGSISGSLLPEFYGNSISEPSFSTDFAWRWVNNNDPEEV